MTFLRIQGRLSQDVQLCIVSRRTGEMKKRHMEFTPQDDVYYSEPEDADCPHIGVSRRGRAFILQPLERGSSLCTRSLEISQICKAYLVSDATAKCGAVSLADRLESMHGVSGVMVIFDGLKAFGIEFRSGRVPQICELGASLNFYFGSDNPEENTFTAFGALGSLAVSCKSGILSEVDALSCENHFLTPDAVRDCISNISDTNPVSNEHDSRATFIHIAHENAAIYQTFLGSCTREVIDIRRTPHDMAAARAHDEEVSQFEMLKASDDIDVGESSSFTIIGSTEDFLASRDTEVVEQLPKGMRRTALRKQKKDPNRPRGYVTASNFFSIEMRKEDDFGDLSEAGATVLGRNILISKRVGEMWKALSPSQREKYDIMARKDKERYLREMAVYTPPQGYEIEAPRINRLEASDDEEGRTDGPDTPARPKGAYAHFSSLERKTLATSSKKAGRHMSKIFGQRWQLMSNDELSCYHAIEAADKARYKEEISLLHTHAAAASISAGAHSPTSYDEGSDSPSDEFGRREKKSMHTKTSTPVHKRSRSAGGATLKSEPYDGELSPATPMKRRSENKINTRSHTHP